MFYDMIEFQEKNQSEEEVKLEVAANQDFVVSTYISISGSYSAGSLAICARYVRR